jgi:hypothetical protein
MVHLPTVIGMIVCEQVIVEKATDNLSLINCFIRKKVASFPSEPQHFAVVAFMTDGSGTIPMELTITESETLDEIERQSVSLVFPSRREGSAVSVSLDRLRVSRRWRLRHLPADTR